jgi:hypothetical protein
VLQLQEEDQLKELKLRLLLLCVITESTVFEVLALSVTLVSWAFHYSYSEFDAIMYSLPGMIINCLITVIDIRIDT